MKSFRLEVIRRAARYQIIMTNSRKWYAHAIIDPPMETWNEGQSRSEESFDYGERKLGDRFCEYKERERERNVISWTSPSKERKKKKKIKMDKIVVERIWINI